MASKAIDILKANGGSVNPAVEQRSRKKQQTGTLLNTPAAAPININLTAQPAATPTAAPAAAPATPNLGIIGRAAEKVKSEIDARKTAAAYQLMTDISNGAFIDPLQKIAGGAAKKYADGMVDNALKKNAGLTASLAVAAGAKATQDKQAVDDAKSAYTAATKDVANKFQAISAVAQRYGATTDNDGTPVFQTQEGLDAYRKAVDSYTAAITTMKDAYTALGNASSVYEKTIGDYKHLSDLYKQTDEGKTATAYKAGKITRESVESELSNSDSEVERLTAIVTDLKASRDDITAQINNLIRAEKNAFPPMSAKRKAANDYAISQLRGQLQSINARIKDADTNLAAEKKNNGMLLVQQRTIEGIEFSDGVEAFKPKYDSGATPFVLAKEVKDAKDAIYNRDLDYRRWTAEGSIMVQNGTMSEDQYNSEMAKRKAAMERQNAKTSADLTEKQKQLAYAWSLYLSDVKDAADFKRMSKETDEGKEAFMQYFRGLNISTLYGDFSDEYKTFNYIYNTKGTDAAEAYLDYAEDSLAQKSGAALAEDFDMPVVREGFAIAHGLTKGLRGIADAINLLTESDQTRTNAMDYAQNMMLQSADAEDRKFAKWLMEAGDSFGNMVPGMAAGAIHPVLGQVVFGASAAGNAYKEYRDEGVDASDAGLGGVLRGLSEVFTQKLLGGLKVPGFSGIFTGKLAETLGSKVGSAAGKAAINYGVDILSEVVEENAQNYIEAAINLGIGAADKFESPTWDDFVDTTMSTFLMTGIMNAPGAVSNAKTIKTSQEFTKQYVNPWIDKTLDSGLAGYSNTKAFAEQLKESIADGGYVDPKAFQAGLLQALDADAKIYNKGGEARLATAQEQADFRADQIEQDNPKATVERSASVQSYINTGKVNLNVAKQAGEVLDGILSGGITSENISDNQIDKLHLTQPFGVKATSEVLGVEIKKAVTKSEARATFRATLNNIEQNKVATEQTNTAQIEQTMDNAVVAESNLAADGEKTVSPAVRSPMQIQTVEQTAEAPAVASAQIEAAPMQEMDALPAPTIRAASENAMSFSEFRKQFENDKAFRRKYSVSGKAAVSKATQLAAAYEKYKADVAASDSSGAMTRSEFARSYIADNGKASDTDIDLAYQDYLENNDMERLSDTVSENVATLDNDVSGLVQNEYSEMIPAEDAESIDALCKLLDRRMVVDDLGDSNGEWSADGDIKIDAAPEHSGAKSAFVFVAAHEIGHDVKSKISKDAWTALEDSAISAKGETAVSDKQASNEVYSDEAVAREDVACDFIGELLSDKDTLDTFLRSIKAGEQTENLTGIRAVVAATKSFINKITGKQKVNADTEALVQRVQDAFGTDIETARKAVDAMQKAVTAAMKANKNATGKEQLNIDNAEGQRYNKNKDGGIAYENGSRMGSGLAEGISDGRFSDRATQKTGENGRADQVVSRIDLNSELESAFEKRGVVPTELYDYSADSGAFSSALDMARESDTDNGWCVTPQTADDLKGKTLCMDENNTIGFAVTKDGDIEGVFKNKSNKTRRAFNSVMPQAIEAGGVKLDCYGEALAHLYEDYGFKPVARVEFNEEYANPGWDESKGKPYIYFMVHNGDSAATVVKNIGKYEHLAYEDYSNLPTYDKEGYDDAAAYRDNLLSEQRTNKNATEDGGVKYNKKDSLREGLISDKMEKDYSKRLVHEVTGEIREGDGIILDDSEKAAIASNLKTGNGHLFYGTKNGYLFEKIAYIFSLNSDGSITVLDYMPNEKFTAIIEEDDYGNRESLEGKNHTSERDSLQSRIQQRRSDDGISAYRERAETDEVSNISEKRRIRYAAGYSEQSSGDSRIDLSNSDNENIRWSKKDSAVSETPTVENYSEKTGMDLTTVKQVERAVERAQQRDAVSEEVAAESVKAADKAVDDALKAGAQKKQMVLPSKAEAERISQRAEATLQRAAEESFFRGLAKTAAAQKVNDEVKAIKAAERAQKKAEAVKAQYDKKIDNLKAQLAKTKKQSELESAFRKDAEKYNERLSREVDRANERTEQTKATAKNKESNLKQKLSREQKQSELESAFRKDAEKQGRALQREIDRLTKQRDRLVRAIQKDALMSAKSSKDAADAIRNWRRKSNIGEAALSEQEVDTRILNAKEQAKIGKGTSPKMRDRLKSVGRQLAYYFSSDVLPFEEMGRLQDRLDSVDTRVTGYRNAGSSVNAILTDCLRAPDGSILDDRSVQAILGCWKDGKVGGKIDEARQQLFDRYLYHMHNIDRMGAEPRARAAMQAFLEKHPEYKQYALDILQKDGTIKQKNLTIKTYDVIEAAENGDAVAQEYIDLAKAFASAKNKAVFGSGDGRVLSAKTSEVIAKQMEAENPWLADKANEFYSWWDKFMQAWYVGVQGTESQYEAMKKLYPHYVPTYRAFKKTGGLWAFSNNGINARDAVRKAKGSIQDLNTVGDNVSLQIERIVKGAREAELFSNVYEEVMNDTDGFSEYAVFSPDEEGLSESVRDMYNEDAVPDARDTESFTKDGDAYTWTGYFNGEKRSMLVSKRVYDSLRALTGASASTLERGAIKAGNTATAPMKTAITGVNVAFATRNIQRDFTTALVNSIAGLEFPKYCVQSMAKIFGQSALSDKIATAMMKAVDANISENERTTRIQDCLKLIEKARVKGSKEWNDFVALGGTGATYARSETGFLWNSTARGKVGAGFNRALSALGAFNEVTESMTRFAEYLATIDKYGDTAEGRIRGIKNAAEVTVDFSRHGRVSRVVNAWAPYWNPAIQGMAKIYRSIRFPGEGNKLVGIDAWKQRGKTFVRGSLAVGIIPRILQFALLGLMGGRDDWDELNDRAKDTYFMIPLGDGKFFKIAYNRDWGQIFGSTFSRIVQGAQGREDNWRDFWDAVIVGNFDPMPNFIGLTQALELKANEDFAGRAIVPRSMDGVERTEQYDEETSWLAKQLAKTPIMAALDLSPVQIDYLLSGYFGDYADMFIEATDADGIAGLEGLLTDVIGNTFTADNAYSSATMGRYYDVMDKLSEGVSTAKFKNPDGYQDLMDYKIQQAISSGFGGRISELNKQIRETENEDEKRVLKFQAQDIAKEALAFYRRCVDGEISDPVRYIKYDGYGDSVRDELIRLSKFENKDEYDYQYTPSDSVPNLGGHKNTDDEKAAYKDIYAENYKAFASDIIASDRYAKASDEEKVGMLEGARELASFYAKKEWATEFNLKGVNSNGKVTYDPSIAEVSASKMFDGKIDAATVGSIMTGIGALEPTGDSESVTSLQKWQYIASRDDITDEQKEIAIRAYMTDGDSKSESELDKCNRWTKAAGITVVQYVDIQVNISDLKPTNGRTGISDVQKAEVVANYNGISKNARWKLLQQMFNSKSNESRNEKITAAQKMVDITPAQYVSVWKQLSEAKGVDMNNDGKNESGSEKWAKMQIIFSLNVSNKTKELLWKSEVDEKTNIWEFYNKYKKKFG